MPVQYCALVNITIAGDSMSPNKVVIPSVNLNSSNSQYLCDRVTINGVRISGGVNLYENAAQGGNADGFIMRNSVIAQNFTSQDVDFSLYKVRAGIGQDSMSSAFRVFANAGPLACILDSSRIYTGANSTYPVVATLYGNKAIEFSSGDYDVCPNTITATRCTLRIDAHTNWGIGVSDFKASIFQSLQNSRFTDNLWQYVDSSGASSGDQGLLFRDRFKNNIFLRDRFEMRTLIGGTGSARVQLTGVGSQKVGGGNVWRYCTFTSNVPTSGYKPAFEFQWQIQPGDSFYRNTVVCSTGATDAGFAINNVAGNAYVGRNTFVNFGSGGAFRFNHDAGACAGGAECCVDGRLTLEGNIFYSKSTATGSDDYATHLIWPDFPAQPRVVSDYNLYSHYGSTSGYRAMKGGYCGAVGTLFSPARIDSAFGMDGNSLYGSPRFTDTTSMVGFNGALLSTSAAIARGPGGVDIGALDFDVTRPDEITNLQTVLSTATQVVLTWTATGDDSLTGTATSYQVRRSTSAISDETAWGNATPVSGTIPTPSASGTTESMIVSGLTAETRYFFAIKAVDEIGYTSAVSNSPNILTQTAGPEIEEP